MKLSQSWEAMHGIVDEIYSEGIGTHESMVATVASDVGSIAVAEVFTHYDDDATGQNEIGFGD